MKKDYQTKAASAATAEFVMPDRVSVAMGELTGRRPTRQVTGVPGPD